MNYKIQNDFSPVVREPLIVMDKLAYKVRMTCGGGLGGHSWFEYIDRTPFIGLGLIDVTDIFTREKMMLNIHYIVKVAPVRVIGVSYDRTANHNLGDVRIEYYAIEDTDTFEVVKTRGGVRDAEKPKSIAWASGTDKVHIR